MKGILIISPHYPPSNLAAVHRSRLFAQHLPSFGWKPIILTVHEDFYEEQLDWNLHQLLPKGQHIEKVNAFPVSKPRLIGDIGLRAFFQLRKRALQLIKQERIDFVYIPIPSFYDSLIGPYLHRKTGVKYGIDYIDPWVHTFPGSERVFSRHWFSTQLAKKLEPMALKHVSLVTGVAEGYYKGVLDRNPQLLEHCIFGAMPYGGEKADHKWLKGAAIEPYLFHKNGKFQLAYAGAMLPKAYSVLEEVFKAIHSKHQDFVNTEFHFIGTGRTPNDAEGYNIKELAEKYGLWKSVVFEYPKRIPYLDVLIHLQAADAVFILGSTEAHYTPSKVYQAVLSEKPLLAILHAESSATKLIQETICGHVLSFHGEGEVHLISECFNQSFHDFFKFSKNYSSSNVNMRAFDAFSAQSVTLQLAKLLDQIVPTKESFGKG